MVEMSDYEQARRTRIIRQNAYAHYLNMMDKLDKPTEQDRVTKKILTRLLNSI